MGSTVFHVSRDASDVLRALRSAENLLSVIPDAAIHVIVNGPALGGIVAVGSLPDRSDSVRVSACSIGLKSHGIPASDLPEGIGVVDSAVAQLSREQWAGSAYIAF